MADAPIVLVIMGVSGSGKSTLGRRLAERLGWPFQEGDDLHPPANVAKMEAGTPLDDADRAPWLAAVGRWIDDRTRAGSGGVITCSALKRAYRELLSRGRPQVRFVFLNGAREAIATRLAGRHGHFMPPDLLTSQFADLEPPGPDEHPIAVDIAQSPGAQADGVVAALATDPESLTRWP